MCKCADAMNLTNLQLLTIAFASISGSLSGYLASRVCFTAALLICDLISYFSGLSGCT
jgi:hypothetical protein